MVMSNIDEQTVFKLQTFTKYSFVESWEMGIEIGVAGPGLTPGGKLIQTDLV